MSISLTDHPSSIAEITKLAGELMEQPVSALEPINQGANSRVYRLNTASGSYVLKFYFQHPNDSRDRLHTEFKSFSFLWEQGIRQIPQAVKSWPKHSCALYTLVKGDSIHGAPTNEDIDQAADFLNTLNSLSKSVDYQEFAPASEAYFCGRDIVHHLRTRLKRFDHNEDSSEYKALQEYLKSEYVPLLKDVENWSKNYLIDQGGAWDQELLDKYRTLSPSDFGFHNALHTPSGEIAFFDFEYFGWDDPVKSVSDFLWHPGMKLTETLKKRFVDRMQGVFSEDPHFRARLKALFPLFGLKWCLILLNEFVAVDMQRRGFAQTKTQDKSIVRLNQLARAHTLSEKIKNDFKDFPYGN